MVTGTIEAPDGWLTDASIEAEVGEHITKAEKEFYTPTKIIRDNQDWYVDLKWHMDGSIVPVLCGNWQINLFLESIGPGAEFDLPSEVSSITVPFKAPTGQQVDYTYRYDVSKGLIKPEHFSSPYKVVATISFLTCWGKPGAMAGFVELPLLQFYHAD